MWKRFSENRERIGKWPDGQVCMFWQKKITELLVNAGSMLTAAWEWLEPLLRPHPLCYLSEVPLAGI